MVALKFPKTSVNLRAGAKRRERFLGRVAEKLKQKKYANILVNNKNLLKNFIKKNQK